MLHKGNKTLDIKGISVREFFSDVNRESVCILSCFVNFENKFNASSIHLVDSSVRNL
jgi:hypothetical protein